MKRAWVFILATSCCAIAQDGANVKYQGAGSAGAMTRVEEASSSVKGAPYSATTNSESIQILADGNRITQTYAGVMARDSEGRTRQDVLSPASAPRLVFIRDPVAGVSFILNLTDKTVRKNPTSPAGAGVPRSAPNPDRSSVQIVGGAPSRPSPSPAIVTTKDLSGDEQSEVSTEPLGSQVMEGVVVHGERTTYTIPAGQIGNDQPIVSVTEVWTSSELNTIVSSKRKDPRIEETFWLTNVERMEPEPSLFTVPLDFEIIDGGPKPIIRRKNQ